MNFTHPKIASDACEATMSNLRYKFSALPNTATMHDISLSAKEIIAVIEL